MNIKDASSLLNANEVKLLKQSATLPFRLENFTSLDDLLDRLQVDVIIEPGIPVRTMPSGLEETEAYWRKKVEQLKTEIEIGKTDENGLKDELENAMINHNNIQSELKSWNQMSLLGVYVAAAKKIILYPEAMRAIYQGNFMDELL